MLVPPDSPQRMEAKRLLALLSWVGVMDAANVPGNSLLREFIGGSNLRDYRPGAALFKTRPEN